MSYRYNNAFVKPGLNTLVSPAPQYTYGLWAWGGNYAGALGLGNSTYYSSPKQVGSLTNWNPIQSNNTSGSTLAVKTDGTLWAWGLNNYSQLGLNNTTNYSSPKQVGSLTNWLNASTSYSHGLAVKTDGTLWSWGANDYGQLGLGNTTSYSSPKQIGSLTNWSSVVSTAYFTTRAGASFAIKTDGTLWSWGYNFVGQLGLNNRTNYSSPKQIGLLTNWSSISSYGITTAFVVAVKTDGTLWTWGNNGTGQLGLNNRTSYSSPKQVGSLTTWLSASAGGYFMLAKKTDKSLWAWGQNNHGELGLGNRTNYSSPKQIGSLTNWLSISAGLYYSAVVKTDGSLWTWGSGGQGSLGLNNTNNYSSPKQVGSLTTWSTVSCSSYSAFALQL